MHEAFGVFRPLVAERALTLGEHFLGSTVMNFSRVCIAIPPWRCLVLYHGKEDRQKLIAAWMSGKRPGKPERYFWGRELDFREGVVVTDPGTASMVIDTRSAPTLPR